ncbi:TIGR02147 family protein [Bdellovibrio sp. HCB2-146]|uniref:TIGR02147 family protein n=1 Tax=Bdellovibrio sp. HCB2-146 TaxID=3394362 RepID=UPI0039BD2C19
MNDSNRSVASILTLHYEHQKLQKDGKYSLRSFAKDLGLSPGRLTELLQQTNIPTIKTLEKIATSLKLSEIQRRELFIAAEQDKKQRLLHQADVVLKEQDLHLIVDWVPYAIVSLLMTRDFHLSAENVSTRLGVSFQQASDSIEKLKQFKMIYELDGKWIAGKPKIATETDIPSEMIRHSHREKMELAVQRMNQVPVELRDFSSITFPADPKNLEVAKKMIIDFRRTLAETMSRGGPTEVYSLNLQLFPLSVNTNQEI